MKKLIVSLFLAGTVSGVSAQSGHVVASNGIKSVYGMGNSRPTELQKKKKISARITRTGFILCDRTAASVHLRNDRPSGQ
jgi:hypothetical protein